MKKIKKLFVVALTFVLSIVMVNTVSAATTGRITVNGTTEGKTYEIYKIFDLTYSGNKVAYTIDADWEEFFSASGAGAEYIVDENTGSLNAITVQTENGLVTKYINITDDNVAGFTDKALTYTAQEKLNADKSAVANGTTLEFTGLELGYYLVYPQSATEVLEGYASICSITSTTPEATVDIKAGYPTIDKTVDRHSFDVGEYATFTITGKVPDTTGFTTYIYKIHDSWTEGLDYDANGFNMEVTIGDDTLTVTEGNLTVTGNKFTLTIDVKNSAYKVGEAITVTYRLKVNSHAINSNTTNNSAYLEYSSNPKTEETTTTPVIEVPVYSSRIEVLKVDGEDKTTPLAGAKFVLQNSEGKYYQITGSYLLLESNEAGEEPKFGVNDIAWVDNIADATVFTTNVEGIISYTEEGVWMAPNGVTTRAFEGLKDGTYYLVETEAPEGYNKLVNPIEVKVEGSEDTNKRPIPVVKNVTVENNSGTQLPSTGGFGTKMFIMIGSLLAVVSAIVLVTNKRMSKEFI